MIKKTVNWIGNNGVMTSIIATIIISVFIYSFTNQGRVLAYEILVNEKVLDQEIREDFHLQTKDSIKITDNFFVFEVQFWNQGRTAIRKNDVKDFVKIELKNNSTFYKKIRLIESHPGVSKSNVIIHDNNQEVHLDFDFLEIGNLIKIHGYYYGKNKNDLNIESYIIDGGIIKKYDSIEGKYSSLIKAIFTIVYLLSAGKLLLYLNGKISRLLGFKFQPSWNGVALAAIYIIFNIIIIYSFYCFILNLIDFIGVQVGIHANLPPPKM